MKWTEMRIHLMCNKWTRALSLILSYYPLKNFEHYTFKVYKDNVMVLNKIMIGLTLAEDVRVKKESIEKDEFAKITWLIDNQTKLEKIIRKLLSYT